MEPRKLGLISDLVNIYASNTLLSVEDREYLTNFLRQTQIANVTINSELFQLLQKFFQNEMMSANEIALVNELIEKLDNNLIHDFILGLMSAKAYYSFTRYREQIKNSENDFFDAVVNPESANQNCVRKMVVVADYSGLTSPLSRL